MQTAEAVVRALRARGDLWQRVPGLTALRGPARALHSALAHEFARLAAEETGDDWLVPSGVSLDTLARADYFASFPHWLTVAGHLSDEPAELAAIARAERPAQAAVESGAQVKTALAPAVCYHVYDALADRTVGDETIVTAEATCWRHEGTRVAPLERGWAFSMREIVCIGSARAVRDFLVRGQLRVIALAEGLGLDALVVEATDPFFAPTARGKALLQAVKGLKQELLVPHGPTQRLAVASFNNHGAFFGEAFAIALPNGEPAHTACIAFGVERWLLAVLCAHGTEPAHWPSLPGAIAVASEER